MTGKASRRGKDLQKQRYDKLKELGLCVICKTKVVSGIRCEACKEQRKRQNRIYRIKKKLNQKTNNRTTNGIGFDFH